MRLTTGVGMNLYSTSVSTQNASTFFVPVGVGDSVAARRRRAVHDHHDHARLADCAHAGDYTATPAFARVPHRRRAARRAEARPSVAFPSWAHRGWPPTRRFFPLKEGLQHAAAAGRIRRRGCAAGSHGSPSSLRDGWTASHHGRLGAQRTRADVAREHAAPSGASEGSRGRIRCRHVRQSHHAHVQRLLEARPRRDREHSRRTVRQWRRVALRQHWRGERSRCRDRPRASSRCALD